MKGRTKFFNYFIACIATLSLATFAACSDDDPETPSGKLGADGERFFFCRR